MVSKSRLGKGLGALFPPLPDEPEEDSKSGVDTKVVDVSRETSTTKKVTATSQSKKSVANKAKTVHKSDQKDVSRETSAKTSDDATKHGSETSASAKAGSSKKQSSTNKAHANVSRETKAKPSRKRMTMPSIGGLEHPSDLFFGNEVSDSEIAESQVDSQASSNSQKSVVRDKSASVSHANDREGNNESAKANDTASPNLIQGGYLAELKLDQIGPNAHQPRTIFDEDELQELADSLREVGVLQPIVVRKRPGNQHNASQKATAVMSGKKSAQGSNPYADDDMGSEYELIMGERRWRAAHLAGLESIPAIVKTTSDNQMLRDALLENLHRVALNPLEEAAAYQQMMDDFGLTQEQLAKSVSKSRSQIANTLRLLNLPPSVQKKVGAGVLSAGHARALLGLPTVDDMDKLAQRILAEGLSVRSTEEIVAMKTMVAKPSEKQEPKRKNPWLDSPIAQNLENRFDTKVAIKGSKKHGRIEIVFSSPEDMDRILELLIPGKNKSNSEWV